MGRTCCHGSNLQHTLIPHDPNQLPAPLHLKNGPESSPCPCLHLSPSPRPPARPESIPATSPCQHNHRFPQAIKLRYKRQHTINLFYSGDTRNAAEIEQILPSQKGKFLFLTLPDLLFVQDLFKNNRATFT